MRSRASSSALSACGSQAAAAASISAVPIAQADLRQVDAVELAGVVEQRGVAAAGDVGDDGAHGLLDILRSLAFRVQKGAETLGEIRSLSFETQRHERALPGPPGLSDVNG